jgi:hypothetical protein
MFPFIPFAVVPQPVAVMVPVAPMMHAPWPPASLLDRRTNRKSRYGKETILGSGANHHDMISFSLENDKEPSDETLVVTNPVRAKHYMNYPTDRLKALFEELSDLQESRTWAPDVAYEEIPSRQDTLDILADVLRHRIQWLGDKDDKDDKDDEDNDAEDDDDEDPD